MTRVLSGAVLVVVAVGMVWLAPPMLFQVAAFGILFLCVTELVGLARAGGLNVPMWLTASGSFVTLAAFGLERSAAGRSPTPLVMVLMVQVVAVSAAAMVEWTAGNRHVLADVAATLFPSLYLALPIGALVAIRETEGPPALFLLMLTVIVSDTAQYYTGRLIGRTPLARSISPKKTLEGAIGGFVFGTVVFTLVGAWWLTRMPMAVRALVGLTLVASGIAGDLFESLLKRSANVKDSSSIIPGHGGMLDRLDALLFAAPVYYVVLSAL